MRRCHQGVTSCHPRQHCRDPTLHRSPGDREDSKWREVAWACDWRPGEWPAKAIRPSGEQRKPSNGPAAAPRFEAPRSASASRRRAKPRGIARFSLPARGSFGEVSTAGDSVAVGGVVGPLLSAAARQSKPNRTPSWWGESRGYWSLRAIP